ncbi:MAG: PAS domain S-box protein, partial [Eubacterium sp.]
TLSINLYQADRTVVPFDVEMHRFSYGEKNYYAIVAIDRKRLQERERYIEEQSNRLMEIEHIASLGYWVLNQQTKEVTWSRELYEILGYEINTIKPNMDVVFSIVHPADQERVTKAFLGAIQNQQAVDIHHRIISIKNEVLDVIVRIRHRFSEKNEHLSTIGIVQNITEQKEMQKQLNYQSHFSKAIVDDSDVLVLITDEQDRIVDVNPYIETITGKSSQELVGVAAETIFGKFQYMPGKKSRSIVDKDGRIRWIYWNSRTLSYFDGRNVIVGVGLDVSEGVEYRQKFEYLAYHEPVTGMSSRLKLSEVLERYFGSQIGDQLIQQVCGELYNKVGHYGLLARYSDDTLIMFLPNRNAQEKIESICEEILKILNTACEIEGKSLMLGGQIGIAKYPDDAESKDELMRF